MIATAVALASIAAFTLSSSFSVPDVASLNGTYGCAPHWLDFGPTTPARLTIDPKGIMRLGSEDGKAGMGPVLWDSEDLVFRSTLMELDMRVRVVPGWWSYRVFVSIAPVGDRCEELEFRRTK